MSEQNTLSEKLNGQDLIDPAMISSALEYWFSDNVHIRSPFPPSIRQKLAEDATKAMLRWTTALAKGAKEELNEEMLAEKFEEILFEIALNMVDDEDQKISIRYPFMPRLGDKITSKDGNGKDSVVLKRRIEKKGDSVYLIVEHVEDGTEIVNIDEFELPE